MSLIPANVGDALSSFSPTFRTAVEMTTDVMSSTVTYHGGFRVVALSSSAFVAMWKSASGPTFYLAAGTVATNGTITLGTPVTFTSTLDSVHFDLVVLSSTRVLIANRHTTTAIRVRTADISGTTITVNSTTSITTTSSDPQPGLGAFSATRAVVSYVTTGQQNFVGLSIAGGGGVTVDGSVVGISGSASVSSIPSMFRLSSTVIIATYDNSTGNTVLRSVVLTDSGTAVSGGTPVNAGGFVTATTPLRLEIVGDNTSAVLFNGTSSGGSISIATISGTTLTWTATEVQGFRTPYIISGAGILSSNGALRTFCVISGLRNTGGSLIQLLEIDTANRSYRVSSPVAITDARGVSPASPCDLVPLTANRVLSVWQHTSTQRPMVQVIDV